MQWKCAFPNEKTIKKKHKTLSISIKHGKVTFKNNRYEETHNACCVLCVSHWLKAVQSVCPAAVQHVRSCHCLLFKMPSVGLLLLRRAYVFLMALCEAGEDVHFLVLPSRLVVVTACCSQHYTPLAVCAAIIMWKSVRPGRVFCAAANKLLPLSLLPPLVFSYHFR